MLTNIVSTLDPAIEFYKKLVYIINSVVSLVLAWVINTGYWHGAYQLYHVLS